MLQNATLPGPSTIGSWNVPITLSQKMGLLDQGKSFNQFLMSQRASVGGAFVTQCYLGAAVNLCNQIIDVYCCVKSDVSQQQNNGSAVEVIEAFQKFLNGADVGYGKYVDWNFLEECSKTDNELMVVWFAKPNYHTIRLNVLKSNTTPVNEIHMQDTIPARMAFDGNDILASSETIACVIASKVKFNIGFKAKPGQLIRSLGLSTFFLQPGKFTADESFWPTVINRLFLSYRDYAKMSATISDSWSNVVKGVPDIPLLDITTYIDPKKSDGSLLHSFEFRRSGTINLGSMTEKSCERYRFDVSTSSLGFQTNPSGYQTNPSGYQDDFGIGQLTLNPPSLPKMRFERVYPT